MLLRIVWAYWFNTSLGGKQYRPKALLDFVRHELTYSPFQGTATDPDLKKLREPWADPVVRENIMYSGHLLYMVAL